MSSTNPDSKPANLITAWTQRDWCWIVVFMVFLQRILDPVFPNWVAFIGLCLKTIPSARERAVLALARTSKQAYLNNTSIQTDAARDKTSRSKPGTSFQTQPNSEYRILAANVLHYHDRLCYNNVRQAYQRNSLSLFE
jgi:hypothetical protein